MATQGGPSAEAGGGVLAERLTGVRRWSGWAVPLVRFSRAKPVGAVGLFILVVVVALAIFGSYITPYDPLKLNPPARLQGPGLKHLFGTDEMGRDVFSRVILGARTSVTVSFVSVFFSSLVSLVLGVWSGYYGGKVDMFVQRLVDALMALPLLVFAMALVATMGASMLNVIIALSVVMIPINVRVIRGVVLSLREWPYIEAARAVGASNLRIMVVHVTPNVMAPTVILASIGLGAAILVEASLAFLGLGVPPPWPSWGRMLTGGARMWMQLAPWLVIFPGIAISISVLAINLFGDALRDYWDPRQRGTR